MVLAKEQRSIPQEKAQKDDILETIGLIDRVEQTYFSPDFTNPSTQDKVLDGLLAISKSNYFKTPAAQIVRDHLSAMGKDPVLTLRFVERLETQNGNLQAMRDSLTLAEALNVQGNPLFQPLLNDLRQALEPKAPAAPKAPVKKRRHFWQKSQVWQTVARDAAAVGVIAGLGQVEANIVGPLQNQAPKPAAAAPAVSSIKPPLEVVLPTSPPQISPTEISTPIVVAQTKPESSPTPQEKFLPTPSPAPTLEPPKPTEVPKRPEANLKGDILKDVFIPKLLAEAQKKDAELNARDPGRAARLNPEINKDRFTMLLLGMGSETDVQMTDTLLLVSVSRDGSVKLISIPRDTYAPEVDQYKRDHEIGADKFNAINTAFQIGSQTEDDQGGFDLVRKSVEDATGLAVHYPLKVRIEALQYLVDNFTGPVTVDVDIDADLLHAQTGDANHDGANVVLHHGVQALDGEQIQELARFRADSYVTYREPGSIPGEVGRVERLQHRIIPAVFKAMADKFKVKDDNPFAKGVEWISKAPNAKQLYDVIGAMVDQHLIESDSNIMSLLQDYAGTFVWAVASGANISVNIPPMQALTLDEEHGLGSAGEITNQFRPDLRVVESPEIHDPKKADNMEPLQYWDKFRKFTQDFILGQ